MDDTWEKYGTWYSQNGFTKYVHEDWKSKYKLFDLEDGSVYDLFEVWRRRFHELDPFDFGDFDLYRKGDEYHVDCTIFEDNDLEETHCDEYHFDSEGEFAQWLLEELEWRDDGCEYLLCDYKEDVPCCT